VSGEVLVVVGPLRQRETGRRLVLKALQQAGHVIRTLLLILPEEVDQEGREAALVGTRLGDQRQVGGKRAAIGGTRGLFVQERRREIVGRSSGPCACFSMCVRGVLYRA